MLGFMEWVLIAAGLWVIGLFVPWGGTTMRYRAEPASVFGTMFGGFVAVAAVAGILGLIWLAAAVVIGILP